MRELARIAVRRRLNQQSLVRALGTQPPNVARYFATKRPQQATVDRLAELLGMDHQHVRIVQDEPLAAEEVLEAERDLFDEVRRSRAFRTDAATMIRAYLRRAPDRIRLSALSDYLLARHRADCGLIPSVDPSGISSALRAFGDALGQRFDLLSLLQSPGGPHETLLLDMYLLLARDHDINHGQTEAILAVLRPALRLANFAVDQMEEPLLESREYHTGVFQMKTLSNTNKRPSTKKASKDQQS